MYCIVASLRASSFVLLLYKSFFLYIIHRHIRESYSDIIWNMMMLRIIASARVHCFFFFLGGNEKLEKKLFFSKLDIYNRF